MGIDDNAWFKAKAFGYGVGLPIAWQGWLLLAAYVAAETAAMLFLADRSSLACITVLAVATIGFLVVTSRKTRGGLRWRSRRGSQRHARWHPYSGD